MKENDFPLVSIIIPIYNVERYLDKCIKSCVSQSYANLQIILVNDGSTDDSLKKCKKWEESDTRIETIDKRNGGLSSARNAGLNAARGEFVLFVDSDDYIEQFLVEDSIDAMTDDIDLVIFSHKKVNSKGEVLENCIFCPDKRVIGNDKERIKYIIDDLLNYKHGWEAWSRLYRGSIIKNHNIDFADNNKIFAEDMFFNVIYALNIRGYKCIGGTYYNYLVRNESIMGCQKNQVNASRMNELCKEIYKYINTNTKSLFYKTHFSLIYERVMNNVILKLKNNGLSLYEIVDVFEKDIIDFKFMNKNYRRLLFNIPFWTSVVGYRESFERLNDTLYIVCGNVFLHNLIHKVNGKFGKLWNLFEIKWWNQKIQGIKFLNSDKRIFLIGTENFGNLGDHEIAESIREFLSKNYGEYVVREIYASTFLGQINRLKKSIRTDDLIIMPGGGNMGDIYELSEEIRHSVIETWPSNRKIIFPQSVYYSGNLNNKLFVNAKRLYTTTNNVSIFLRGRNSYDFAKTSFNCECKLAPDIVLSKVYNKKFARNNRVLICIRNDRESNLKKNIYFDILSILVTLNIQYEIIDLQLPIDIDANYREIYCNEYLDKFAKARFVITDRLHGMIFSTITSTPCFAFDNSYGKISECYEFIADLGYIKMYCKDSNLYCQIENMMNISKKQWDFREFNQKLFQTLFW